MRTKNKYKTYYQVGGIPESFHQRIINFKRPKWKRIQKVILNSNYSPKLLVDNLCVKVNLRNWEKVKTYYKSGLKSKNAVCNSFDSGVGIKHLKKSLKNSKSYQIQENFLESIVKPEFRVDILLARLGFFNTSFEARQSIFSRNIFVNNKVVSGNLLLKKGDIVTLSNSIKVAVDNVFKCFSPTKKIFSFTEVDYYSNTIVITKSLSDLYLQDTYILSVNHFELKKIRDFL